MPRKEGHFKTLQLLCAETRRSGVRLFEDPRQPQRLKSVWAFASGEKYDLSPLMPGIVTKCDTSQRSPCSRIDLLAEQKMMTAERHGSVQKVTLPRAIASHGK